MAAYRFSAKVIGRKDGRSATGAAAYRAAMTITDERTGTTHDYSRRGGVLHAEILTPDGAPEWMANRSRLWNAVEDTERRKDAQLAREIQINLPHELDEDTRRDLVREFVKEEFVSRGMVADISIHAPDREGDNRNHHSHVMLTMRVLSDDGFGKKDRAWNDTALLEQWREQWAQHQNRALEKAGFDVRVDHRSLEAQGIDREPEPKLGPVATQMERDGRRSNAGDDLRDTWTRNAQRELLATQEDSIDLAIAHERLSEARREALARRQRPTPFDDLFQAQQGALQQEAASYQAQIDELSGRLEGRSRIAVWWDKLRGRLGWNAETELEAARLQLRENQERAQALQLAQQQQRDALRSPSLPESDAPARTRPGPSQPADSEQERKAREYADKFKDAAGRRKDQGRDFDP